MMCGLIGGEEWRARMRDAAKRETKTALCPACGGTGYVTDIGLIQACAYCGGVGHNGN